MSAIWGCVDLTGALLDPALGNVMEKPLREYRIDRYECESDGNVMMGCGIQYIHAESDRERLPVFDRKHGIYFTSDCVLDNRSELIAELCPGRSDIPDGELAYLSYIKWRDDAPKHMLGVYSYAAYERETNRLIVAADHTNMRSIYYCRDGDRVYFGTIMESILQGRGSLPDLNEEWLAMYLSFIPLLIQNDPLYTPYNGVKRILASQYRVFEPGSEKAVQYWSPKDVNPLCLGSDEEYRAYFRALMERCAREAVRDSRGEVGILLSSGFDSSSVAAFASPVLEKQGRRLRGYTYVPMEGYVHHYISRIITDESDGVLKLCDIHPNILPKLMSCPGVDGFAQLPEILRIYETPYKSLTNIAWIDELEREAASDGCRLMLDGQTGNITISWGNITTYEKTMMFRGRFFKAMSVMNKYAKKVKISRKRHLLYFLKTFIPRAVMGLGYRDYLKGTFVNREYAKSLGISKRDKRLNINPMFPTAHTFSKSRSEMFDLESFAHVSDADTKLTLKHGLLKRDLTRDIRVFEFCLAAPMECFINDEPATRRCVRSYLSDLLPADILAEDAPRGRQSGDWLYRIMPRWEEIRKELERVCLSPRLSKFVDVGLIANALEKFKDGPGPRDENEFLRLGACYAAGLFLESREWNNLA